MNRTRLSPILAIAALALSGLTTGASEAAVKAQAGVMMWSFEHHGTPVPVAIWYPTHAPEADIPAGPFTLHAASDAAPLSGKHPLLILSHGTGGSSIAHHRIAESLARGGYLIAALEHPGDNYRDRSLVTDARYFDERPRQLRALLAALWADSEINSLIDADRIGAIGHSAGGASVAALIGAEPDRAQLIAHCASAVDDPSCDYADASLGVTAQTDAPFVLPQDAHATPAPSALRIRSAALLAPLGSVISGAGEIDPSVEILITVAEHDSILPTHHHADRIARNAPHAQRHTATGAGHFSFISPVESAWRESLGDVADDPIGFDRDQFNQDTAQSLHVWFDATL